MVPKLAQLSVKAIYLDYNRAQSGRPGVFSPTWRERAQAVANLQLIFISPTAVQESWSVILFIVVTMLTLYVGTCQGFSQGREHPTPLAGRGEGLISAARQEPSPAPTPRHPPLPSIDPHGSPRLD